MLAIPALGRMKQEDGELQASLGYTVRPCLKIRSLGLFQRKYRIWKDGSMINSTGCSSSGPGFKLQRPCRNSQLSMPHSLSGLSGYQPPIMVHIHTYIHASKTSIHIFKKKMRRRGRSQVKWRTPLVPELERQQQQNLCEFRASLDYRVRLKNQNKTITKQNKLINLKNKM